MKKSILNNIFFHGAICLVMAVIMIVDVVRGANSFDEFSLLGKVAGVIFCVDLIGYVLYTFGIALFKKE